jgi:hypothetical protein
VIARSADRSSYTSGFAQRKPMPVIRSILALHPFSRPADEKEDGPCRSRGLPFD